MRRCEEEKTLSVDKQVPPETLLITTGTWCHARGHFRISWTTQSKHFFHKCGFKGLVLSRILFSCHIFNIHVIHRCVIMNHILSWAAAAQLVERSWLHVSEVLLSHWQLLSQLLLLLLEISLLVWASLNNWSLMMYILDYWNVNCKFKRSEWKTYLKTPSVFYFP